MEESFTTFNHVDMSILKKEPLYNHLNLDSLARRGSIKIKINENEDILDVNQDEEEDSSDKDEANDTVLEAPIVS